MKQASPSLGWIVECRRKRRVRRTLSDVVESVKFDQGGSVRKVMAVSGLLSIGRGIEDADTAR